MFVLLSKYWDKKTNGRHSLQVKGSTVREALDDLITHMPELKCLFDETGRQVRRFVHVLRNGHEVRTAEQLACRVTDDEELIIFPDIA